MTPETFLDYLKNHFHPFLLKSAIALPVIIFIDDCGSLLSPEVSDFCKTKQIVNMALYPTTELMQPIHIAVFQPLSEPWQQAVMDSSSLDCGTSNMSKSLSRDSFIDLLKRTMVCTLEPELFKRAFSICGLSPFGQIIEIDHTIEYSGVDHKPLVRKVKTATHVLQAVEDLIDKDKLLNFYRHGNKAWPNDCSKDLFHVWKALKDRKVLEENDEEEIEEDVTTAAEGELDEGEEENSQNRMDGQTFKDEPVGDYYLGLDSIP